MPVDYNAFPIIVLRKNEERWVFMDAFRDIETAKDTTANRSVKGDHVLIIDLSQAYFSTRVQEYVVKENARYLVAV